MLRETLRMLKGYVVSLCTYQIFTKGSDLETKEIQPKVRPVYQQEAGTDRNVYILMYIFPFTSMAHYASFININSSLDALPFLIRPLEILPGTFQSELLTAHRTPTLYKFSKPSMFVPTHLWMCLEGWLLSRHWPLRTL